MKGVRCSWCSLRVLTVAICLLGLTAAAVLVPQPSMWRGDGTLLVLLPVADPRRQEALMDLASYLSRRTKIDLHLQVVADRQAFADALPHAVLTLSPDAVGMGLPSAGWQALATGRRRVPWNRRPTSVLVTRGDPVAADQPWRTGPGRTAFGDSLSLVCLAPLCRDGRIEPLSDVVMLGRDPYDHGDVLAALAHGAFDHAVVREWDAAAAMSAGLLDPAQWRLLRLSGPLPDVVVFVSRRLSGAVRLDLQEALTMLGRSDAELAPADRLAQVQLGHLGLDGFNPLLEADIERLRRQHAGCWPDSTR